MTPGAGAIASANSSDGASLDEGIAPHTAGPMARDEHWSHLASRWGASLHVLGRRVAADRRACSVPAAAADGLADHAHDRDVHGAGRPEQGDPPRRARRDRDSHRAEPARQGGAAHQPAPVAARPGGRPARARARRRTRGRALRGLRHRQRPGRHARRARRARERQLAASTWRQSARRCAWSGCGASRPRRSPTACRSAEGSGEPPF